MRLACSYLFREELPHGIQGVFRVAAFASLVAGAVLLSERRAPAT